MHKLDIRFTGSGSEYFRLWIVNLLLTFVTLGLYYPWAKARRLRYFSQNTLVGNDEVGHHAMDFHGKPAAMLRGQLLGLVLLVAYSVASKCSVVAAITAMLLLASIAPALFNVALRFKLANTSWRGMRFRFTGTLPGAYRAILPMYIPFMIIVAIGTFAPEEDPYDPDASQAASIAILVVAAIAGLMAPWCIRELKRFQHKHYAFGQLQTRFEATTGQFYGLFLKMAGIMILVGAVAGGLMWLCSAPLGGTSEMLNIMRAIGLVAVMLASLALPLIFVITLKPYLISRFQNLVWSGTRNEEIRFYSELRWGPLFRLSLKNWLLIILTLGFYWPFAAVAQMKLRLTSVTIATRASPDEIVNQAAVEGKGAFGDAASDLFGLDIGL